MKSTKTKTKKNKNKNRIPLSPPVLNTVLRLGCTLRYQKTNASDAAVYTNCFSKLLCMATSATTGACIYESIRIRRFTAWVPGVVNSAAGGFLIFQNGVTLRLDDGAAAPFGQERRVSDIPTSTRGAVVSVKTTGINSMWLDVVAAGPITGQRFLQVTGPVGTIVDMKCAIQVTISRTSAMANLAGAGLTTRVIYGNYLDNTDTTAVAAGTQFLQAVYTANATSFV